MNEVIESTDSPAPALAQNKPGPMAVAPAAGPMGMAMKAMSMGMTIADLQGLLALQKDYEANEARKAYVADMAAFKLNPPEIFKTKAVSYGEGATSYMHATLGDVCERIVEALAKHGFSHRWDTQQQQGGLICVTCTITHRLGHSESTTLSASADQSGKKNNIQAMASTVTYLQRYTLLAATGLATKDMQDDDGAGGGFHGGEVEPQQQAAILKQWVDAAQSATTLKQFLAIRKDAGAAFESVGDLTSWNQFKADTAAKRSALADEQQRAGTAPIQP